MSERIWVLRYENIIRNCLPIIYRNLCIFMYGMIPRILYICVSVKYAPALKTKVDDVKINVKRNFYVTT